MVKLINLLSYDEMMILNRVALDATLKDTIDNIIMQRYMTRDEEIKEIMIELHQKLTQINENEWVEIQMNMPFAVPYDDEDEEDEYEEWSEQDTKEFVEIIQSMEQESAKESEESESGGENGTVAE